MQKKLLLIILISFQVVTYGCGTLNKSINAKRLYKDDIKYINSLKTKRGSINLCGVKLKVSKGAKKIYPFIPFVHWKAVFKTQNENYGLIRVYGIAPILSTQQLIIYNSNGYKDFVTTNTNIPILFDYINMKQGFVDKWNLRVLYIPDFLGFSGSLLSFGKDSTDWWPFVIDRYNP